MQYFVIVMSMNAPSEGSRVWIKFHVLEIGSFSGRQVQPCRGEYVRIAASNTIESLMENDFHLVINDVVHRVDTPPRERMSQVSAAGFSGSTHDRSQQHQHQDPSSHAEDEGADLGKSIMQMNGREL